MRIRPIAFLVMVYTGLASVLGGTTAYAQANLPGIALKNGENVELQPVYWVVNCKSVMVGMPEVEILEGPPGLTLTIRPGMVLPRRQECATKVDGGVLVAAAQEVKEPIEGKLIYRIKFKTKDGDRQQSSTYRVSLFP